MTTQQSRDSRGGGRPGTRRFSGRRRRQCVCKEVGTISYKDVSVLRRFISDRGRIESGRKSGNCAKCQRELSTAISRARFMALLPYAPNHLRVTGTINPAATASEESVTEGESEEKPEAEAENTAAATEEATSEAAEASSEEAETEEATPEAEAAEEGSEEETAEEQESEDTSASVEPSEEDASEADDSESEEEKTPAE